jgi:hypothetical protein
MCCSGSEKDAAEMATIMVGDCIKVTSVLVIVKPYCFGLWREILDVLMWLGFDVFFFWKSKFDESNIGSLLEYCDKFYTNYSKGRVESEWLNNDFIGLKVGKICGAKELQFILNVFDLVSEIRMRDVNKLSSSEHLAMRESTGYGFAGEPSVEAEIRDRIKNFKNQEGSLNHSCDYPKVAGGFIPPEKTSYTAAKLATGVLDPKSNSRRSIEDIFHLADRDLDQEGNDFINKSNLNKFVIPCIDPELENIFYKASIETIPYFDLINPSTDNNTIKDLYTVLYRETTDSAGTEISFEEYDTTNHTFKDHMFKGKQKSRQQQNGVGHGNRADHTKPHVSREGSTRG